MAAPARHSGNGAPLSAACLVVVYSLIPTLFGSRRRWPASELGDGPRVVQGQALAWMSELLLERGQRVVSCFSVTLGAVVFRGAHARHGPCESSELLSYMQVLPVGRRSACLGVRGHRWRRPAQGLSLSGIGKRAPVARGPSKSLVR